MGLRALIAMVVLALGAGPGLAAPAAQPETAAPAAQPETTAPTRPYLVQAGVQIPTRDGTRLSAVIVRPRTPGPHPVILTFTPYGVDRYYNIAAFYARHGYVGAVVSVRGRGDSEGDFSPYRADARDGYDVVQWLASQAYADGRVAMRGASYTGWLQWAIAALRPPALKTIIPAAPPYHGVDTPHYRGVGAPYYLRWYAQVSGRELSPSFSGDLEYWRGLEAETARGEVPYAEMDEVAGAGGDYWRELVNGPNAILYWLAVNPRPEDLARIEIPILAMTGAYDVAQMGAQEHYYRHLRANLAAAARTWFIMGPWDHWGVSSRQTRVGGVEFGPAAEVDSLALHLSWFDWVLKGGPRPSFLKGRATYYVLGPDEWRGADTLEPSPVRQVFTLSSPQTDAAVLARPGALAAGRAAREPRDRFVWDPRQPPLGMGPFSGEESIEPKALLDNGLAARLHGQGVIYETAPAAAAYDIVGRPHLALRAALDVPDFDFIATLYDVAPDGRSVTLAQDLLRARYRDGMDRPRLAPIGQAQAYEMTLGWVGRRIPAGHRLRLLITTPAVSAAYERNRHTGGVVSREIPEQSRTAVVSVLVGQGGSRLVVPMSRPFGPGPS